MNRLLHCLALIVYVLLVTKFTVSVDVKCIERERLALLELKQGFVDVYDRLPTWGDGQHQKECCNWTGIHCSPKTNHVVSLDLHGPWDDENFTWPKVVTNLTHLEKLDLSYCHLVGHIPEQLGALSQLQYLDLSGNYLTGIIPHQLGNLSQLQYLDLSDNYLTGIIPHQLGNLSQLKDLTLGFNKLHGYIPNQLEHLSCLQRLNLQQNQLSGTIPNSLLDLCHLRLLDLSLNNFSGHLEDFLIGTMGRTSRCSHQFLQTLDLSSNELTGSIPDLSFLMELQVLDLSHNELNETLSDGIGQLSDLVRLVIGSNPLQGTITEHHFSQLSKLVHLDMSNTSLSFNISKSWIPPFQLVVLLLDDCKIGPYFPEWLKNQRNIKELTLQHSEIVDVLPDWFWRNLNSNLTHLDLSNNKIQGEIPNLPVQFFNFPIIDLSANQMSGEIRPFLFQAPRLYLSTNMFSGSILPSLCSVTTYPYLYILDISRNQFSEDLSADCWLHFKWLLYLDLSVNNFSGEVPASLFSLPNLLVLHLGNNKFRSIPSLLSSDISSLRSLDLSGNGISGFLPSWIGDKLYDLKVLSLRNNNFYGSMPFNICNLTKIQVLDLSANHLTGFIPKCFDQFAGLSNSSLKQHDYLDTSDSITVTWKGELFEIKIILRLQRIIDLSNNQLIGEIPIEIMDLVELRSLNLSSNKLGGEIDQKVGKLKNLESLDLSRNQLHGLIPPSISQLNFLDKLNLSFNNLSGKIPTGSQLQTLNDASIYRGNSELCGPPLDRICPNEKQDGRQDHRKSDIIDEGEDDNDNLFEKYGCYFFMALGFIVGFWASCGSLIFNRSWRYYFFNLCTSICDNVYLKVRISINKLWRRLEA